MLMMYYVYITVIHDCMYVRNIVNILCKDVAVIVCISYEIFLCVRPYGDDFNKANYHHCIIKENNF